MSIERMKKFSLVALKEEREAIMRDLLLLGCVEVGHYDDMHREVDNAEFSRLPGNRLSALIAEKKNLEHARNLLMDISGTKESIFVQRPRVAAKDFLDDAAYEGVLQIVDTIEALEKEQKQAMRQKEELTSLYTSLLPWVDLPLLMQEMRLPHCSIFLGSLPPTVKHEAILRLIEEESLAACYVPVSTDAYSHYVLFVVANEETSKFADVMRPYGFSSVQFEGLEGTVRDNVQRLSRELKDLAATQENLKERLLASVANLPLIRQGIDQVNVRIRSAKVEKEAMQTENTILFWGWVPAKDTKRVQEALKSYLCEIVFEDPTKDEVARVPVKLTNPAWLRPLNMVTEMYSLPRYDGIDPNPLMFLFFLFFFGFMFADIGYGIVIVVASLWMRLKLKPRGTLDYMTGLGILVGVSSALCGILTGSFFGDAVSVYIDKFTMLPKFTPWSLVNPLENPMGVLAIGLAIGCVHLLFGQLIHLYMGFRESSVKGLDALLDVLPWWTFFAGIGYYVYASDSRPFLGAVLFLVATQGRHAETVVMKFLMGLKSLYDSTGWLSDILSYSRLMALMLAGSAIASVVNLLGSLGGSQIVFFFVFLVGHTFNICINMIGTYVHAARLQYLEFFSKFYIDGGRAFNPLRIDTDYVDVEHRTEALGHV